jgi:ATP-binding cassette subfamily B protein
MPDTYRRFRKLLSYLRPYWKVELAGILALLLVNIFKILIPRLVGSGIDQLKVATQFGQIGIYVFWILLLATLMWFIRMTSRVLLFGVGRQVEFDLKQRLFQHLLRMEPAYFSNNSIGDLINRATSDVDSIRRLVGFSVLSLVNTIFAYGLTFPSMLAIDVELTVWAIAIYPFMLILVQLFSHRLQSEQAEVQEELSDLSTLIQEDMSGMALIKIYAQEANEQRAFRQANQQLYAANLKLAKTRNTLFPLLTGLASFSTLILLGLGSQKIANNTITIGSFVALLQYAADLVFPTALLGFTITAYQRGEVSIDRVEAILLAQPQVQNSSGAIALPLETLEGQLTARHLTYTYPDAPQAALRDISFTITPGETVAIVGPIGSGKSTLANALPRLLDIAPNQLFLDGHDITQIHLNDLRRAIAYVPQESFLFSTSIKNNIRYGAPLAELIDTEYAAKQAQIHAEILNFPQHYETLVGERGITLSGGQRQRTALARALLIDAPVLILDDALSSVDNQTATQILSHLSSGTQRKTVIFITHQLAAAAQADRILVMDQGQVVQSGTHAELVHQPGLYQSLWDRQQLEAVLH